jgi:hypothetical protein
MAHFKFRGPFFHQPFFEVALVSWRFFIVLLAFISSLAGLLWAFLFLCGLFWLFSSWYIIFYAFSSIFQ